MITLRSIATDLLRCMAERCRLARELLGNACTRLAWEELELAATAHEQRRLIAAAARRR